ncbi:MAG: ArnT family glycosyltransferase, partial [Planctomycetota bacterium]
MEASVETPGRKAQRLCWLLILIAATVLPRLVAGYASVPHYWNRGDTNWDAMAQNLVRGHGLLIPSIGPMRTPMYAHKTPVFALVLAGVQVTAGRSPWAVITVQILFALLATWAVYRLGAVLTGRRAVGTAAALIAALYPPFVIHDVQIMETALFRGEIALLTLLLYRAAVRPGLATVLLTGVVAGVTVLTRTTVLLFLPLAAVWLLVAWGRRSIRLLPVALFGVAVFAAVLSPWLIRNARMFGRLHLVTGGGRSLWIGTSDSFLTIFPGWSVDAAEYAEWRLLTDTEREHLAGLDEVELDGALMERARETLRDDRDRIVPLFVRKTSAAFSWRLNPWFTRDRMDRGYSSLKRTIYSVSYAPLLCVGGLGLLLLLVRRRRAGALLALHYVAFEVFTVLFWA